MPSINCRHMRADRSRPSARQRRRCTRVTNGNTVSAVSTVAARRKILPNENGSTYPSGQGDGYLKGLSTVAGGTNNDATSPVVPSSSTFWNKGISNSSDSNTSLNNYPGGGYNNTFDGPVITGNNIHTHLDEYNNFGTINGVQFACDGDTLI